ncbi:MAG TPA: hypothetical protein VFX59_26310 [Polyangiales bacterium]|nr:hypothetical protein [Polyangiales bacterium]
MEMRSSVFPAIAKWLSPLVALSMLGCPKQELAPLGPCTVSAVSERVDQSGISNVDLLFVIDNSGSMASEQKKLAEKLPDLVRVLTLGDRYPDLPKGEVPAGVDPSTREFTAVKALHLGVVSTNAGGIDDFPNNQQAAVLSCAGEGDDGLLQFDTTIAQDGVVAESASEFEGYAKGDQVLDPRPECDIPGLQKYQEFEAGGDVNATSEAFSCTSTLGVRGCPFEQQLESMWKALAPSKGVPANDPLYKFINGSKGQGDRGNEGFLREDAILAVIIVSDEEDCSVTDEGKTLFQLGSGGDDPYGVLPVNLNLRCGQFADVQELVQPVERYIDGLKSLKPDNPDRIIYAAIVGVPEDAIADKEPIESILLRPDMEFMENPNQRGYPMTSCISAAGDKAYPPSRMLRVAQGFPDSSVISSICADDYSPALNTLIEKIASKLKGNCLPRQLTPGDNGLVNCEVFELLPDGVDDCDSAQGLTGKPIERNLLESGKNVKRLACKMDQLAVTGGENVADGAGWYYDNFSMAVKMDCTNAGEQQRIAFKFANGTDLPPGAGATFECFQPVARIDADAKGFDAVNTRCATAGEATDSICSEKQGPDNYKLFCQPDSLTCQISCENNPDCPPGWVCSAPLAAGADDVKYCQLPTCPQDGAGGGAAAAADDT